jgi:hypothetical protein
LPSLSVLVESRSPAFETNNAKNKRPPRKFAKRPLAHFTYVPRRSPQSNAASNCFARGHVLITGFELSTRFPSDFFAVAYACTRAT